MAILVEAGIPKSSVVLEKRGFRPENSSRPGDLVALDFFGSGRHLLLDAVVTTIYRNAIMDKATKIPGHATKLAEDRNFATLTKLHPLRCPLSSEAIVYLSPLPSRMEDVWVHMLWRFLGLSLSMLSRKGCFVLLIALLLLGLPCRCLCGFGGGSGAFLLGFMWDYLGSCSAFTSLLVPLIWCMARL